MPVGVEFVQFIAAFSVEVCRILLKQIFNYVALKSIRKEASSSMTALSVVFAFINSPQLLDKGLGEQVEYVWGKAAPVKCSGEHYPLADLG